MTGGSDYQSHNGMQSARAAVRGARNLRVASWFAIGTLAATAAYAFMEVYFGLTIETISLEALDTIIAIEEAYPLLFIATAVAFIVWSFRAHANLTLFGRRDLNHENQATIWWWIVPIAQFWMPYRVIFETGRGTCASIDDERWKQSKVPSIAVWWTALFIGGLVSTSAASQVMEAATSVGDLDFAIFANTLAFIVYGAAAIVATVMIVQFTKAQTDLAQAVESTPVPAVNTPEMAAGELIAPGIVAVSVAEAGADEGQSNDSAPESAQGVPVEVPSLSDSGEAAVPEMSNAPHPTRRWIRWSLAGFGVVLVVISALVGWQAWSWNQLLERTARVDDAEMWAPYFEATSCDFIEALDNDEDLDAWVFYTGYEANRTIDVRLQGRVEELNAIVLMPWQGGTKRALDAINTHYFYWFDSLESENELMDDVIDGEVSDYAVYYQTEIATSTEIGPSFEAARDAYYSAAPFWVSDNAIEAAFLEGGEVPVSCWTEASQPEGTGSSA